MHKSQRAFDECAAFLLQVLCIKTSECQVYSTYSRGQDWAETSFIRSH